MAGWLAGWLASWLAGWGRWEAEATRPKGGRKVDPGQVIEEQIGNIITYKVIKVVGSKVAYRHWVH